MYAASRGFKVSGMGSRAAGKDRGCHTIAMGILKEGCQNARSLEGPGAYVISYQVYIACYNI